MFFFICSCLLKLSIVLHHILAKEFSKGSTSQHPNIILHYFIANMQTCILILLANIKPLYWGHQSCQYMNISHYHRMVLVRRDFKHHLISPCLHTSTLMHREVNHQSGQLKMPIPFLGTSRAQELQMEGWDPLQILQCLQNLIWHQFFKKKPSLNQNLIFLIYFFHQGHVYFCVSVISEFTLRGAGSRKTWVWKPQTHK